MTRDDFYADLHGPKYANWRLAAIEAAAAARREYDAEMARQNLMAMLAAPETINLCNSARDPSDDLVRQMVNGVHGRPSA